MWPIKRITGIFVAIIVLANATSGVSQTTTGQMSVENKEPPLRVITGIVKDEKGQLSMRETRTNSKGEFTLEKICAGSIVIEVRKEGPQYFTGRATAKGGDKNIKIVISSSNSTRRPAFR